MSQPRYFDPLPARELTDRRFRVSCALCPKHRLLTHEEFIAWSNPHRNEYLDEIARRVRCAPRRMSGQECSITITAEIAGK